VRPGHEESDAMEGDEVGQEKVTRYKQREPEKREG
jgi:hypothetical protein